MLLLYCWQLSEASSSSGRRTTKISCSKPTINTSCSFVAPATWTCVFHNLTARSGKRVKNMNGGAKFGETRQEKTFRNLSSPSLGTQSTTGLKDRTKTQTGRHSTSRLNGTSKKSNGFGTLESSCCQSCSHSTKCSILWTMNLKKKTRS